MDGLTSELILQVVIAAGILAAIALGLFTYLILVIKKKCTKVLKTSRE
jgi:hypothetical protein